MSNTLISQKTPFESFDTNWINRYVNHVTNLINQHDPSFVPPINKKTGKRTKPLLMPWMLPTWNKGLQMAKCELETRAEA